MSSTRRVKLYNDWRGNTAGAVITVNKIVAAALVEQNIAIYDDLKRPKVKKFNKMKEIKEAPADKMLKGASVTK